MQSFFSNIHIQELSSSEYYFILLSSLLILFSLIAQNLNLKKLLTKTSLKNIDILNAQANYILTNPYYAKFYLYPYMFVMLSIYILSIIFFSPISSFLFFSMVLLLITQYVFEYNLFLLKIAYTSETKNISIKKALEEKEWILIREKQKELPDSIILNIQDISFNNLLSSDSTYYKDSNDNIYEVYTIENIQHIDKIYPMLSQFYKSFYSEYNLNKKEVLYLLEAFFSSFVLYLSFKISF